MRIESRYQREKRGSIMVPLTLGLVFSIGAFIGTINGIAENTYAQCPPVDVEGRECGHVIREKHYTEYERGTFAYWNSYCNQMLGTKFACD